MELGSTQPTVRRGTTLVRSLAPTPADHIFNQVRYQPNGQNGETATFTYRAWDQTSGTASTNSTANYASTTSNGGTTAFSSNTATASMVVTSVNDAPTITNAYTHTLTSTNEDTNSSGTLASAILTGATWADVDTGAISGLAITGMTGNGTWQYSTDGTTWNNFGAVTSTNALLITSTTQVRYQPNGQNGETATFTYRAGIRQAELLRPIRLPITLLQLRTVERPRSRPTQPPLRWSSPASTMHQRSRMATRMR